MKGGGEAYVFVFKPAAAVAAHDRGAFFARLRHGRIGKTSVGPGPATHRSPSIDRDRHYCIIAYAALCVPNRYKTHRGCTFSRIKPYIVRVDIILRAAAVWFFILLPAPPGRSIETLLNAAGEHTRRRSLIARPTCLFVVFVVCRGFIVRSDGGQRSLNCVYDVRSKSTENTAVCLAFFICPE